MLKTIEAGTLDVERPLAQYMDKPVDADDADLGRITARHVLTHTTGCQNSPPDGELMTRGWPLGQQWTYSGQGFLYLQAVLESIWNEPAINSLLNSLQRLVFDPLDSQSHWPSDEARLKVAGASLDRIFKEAGIAA